MRICRSAVMSSQPPGRGTRVRGTRQAEALNAVLGDLPAFSSAQDIHAELRRRGQRIGLTTVYRHLQVLAEDGEVDAIRDQGGETLYRRCENSAPPNPMTWPPCGGNAEVESPAGADWAQR